MIFEPTRDRDSGDYSFSFDARHFYGTITIVYSPDMAMWQFSCQENNGDFYYGYIMSGKPLNSEDNYLTEWSECCPPKPVPHADPHRATDTPYFTRGRQYRRPCPAAI